MKCLVFKQSALDRPRPIKTRHVDAQWQIRIRYGRPLRRYSGTFFSFGPSKAFIHLSGARAGWRVGYPMPKRWERPLHTCLNFYDPTVEISSNKLAYLLKVPTLSIICNYVNYDDDTKLVIFSPPFFFPLNFG